MTVHVEFRCNVFPNTFNFQFVEDVELADREGQLYTVLPHNLHCQVSEATLLNLIFESSVGMIHTAVKQIEFSISFYLPFIFCFFRAGD